LLQKTNKRFIEEKRTDYKKGNEVKRKEAEERRA